jgi:hypothetical protein
LSDLSSTINTQRQNIMKNAPTLPIIFRKFRNELCAYFPTEFWARGQIASYAHVGQHGGASTEWLQKGRPASPTEYAELLNELRGIYESNDAEHIKLKVYKRATGKAAVALAV